MDSVRPPRPAPAPRPQAEARTRAVPDDVIPVSLFEDARGRLVVVDGRVRGDPTPADGPLLRMGRLRIALHHLSPPVAARLVADGMVATEGPDALNVLLAFADTFGAAEDAQA